MEAFVVATIAAHTTAVTYPKGPLGARRPVCSFRWLPRLQVKACIVDSLLDHAARVREGARERAAEYGRG
jgi:hypothetical protein